MTEPAFFKVDLVSSKHMKKAIYAAGMICFVMSVIYVALSIRDNWQSVVSARWRDDFFIWIPLVFGSYVASLFTTAFTWPVVLSRLGHPLPIRRTLQIGLLAQIGKYLPGNIAHFFGRAALAKRHNINYSISALSTVIELGSAAIASSLIAIVGLIFSPVLIDLVYAALPGTLFRNAGMLMVAALAVFSLLLCSPLRDSTFLKLLNPSLWFAPVFCLTCSTILVGLSFYTLGSAIVGTTDFGIAAALGIYAAAWVAGFLVPGAPAGFGVREAVLLICLTPLIGPANAILLTISHRMMTTITDCIVAAISAFFYFSENNRNA